MTNGAISIAQSLTLKDLGQSQRNSVLLRLFLLYFAGWIDCAKTSWKEEGRGVFFNGMTATVTRAFIVNAAVFTVYEFLLKVMEEQPADAQAIVNADRH